MGSVDSASTHVIQLMNNDLHMKMKKKTQKFTDMKLTDVNSRQRCGVLRNGSEALLSLSLHNLLYRMFTDIPMCMLIRYLIISILDK